MNSPLQPMSNHRYLPWRWPSMIETIFLIFQHWPSHYSSSRRKTQRLFGRTREELLSYHQASSDYETVDQIPGFEFDVHYLGGCIQCWDWSRADTGRWEWRTACILFFRDVESPTKQLEQNREGMLCSSVSDTEMGISHQWSRLCGQNRSSCALLAESAIERQCEAQPVTNGLARRHLRNRVGQGQCKLCGWLSL